MTLTNRLPAPLVAATSLVWILACASPDPIVRTDIDPIGGDLPTAADETSVDPGRDLRPVDDRPAGDPGSDTPLADALTDPVGDTALEAGGDAAEVQDSAADVAGEVPGDVPGETHGDLTTDGLEDFAISPDAVGTPLVRTCEAVLKYRGTARSVTVPGEWNAWNPAAHPMTDPGGDGNWSVTVDLKDVPPGSHGYKFLVDGSGWTQDLSNPLTLWDPTFTYENSKLRVPDCSLPALELVSASADWAARTVTVEAQVHTGLGGEPLLATRLRAESLGRPVDPGFDPATQRFRVRLTNLSPGKHSVTFRAATSRGEAEPLFVPVWLEEKPFAWQDSVLYFAMTDRFANGDPENDAPAPCVPAEIKKKGTDWMGGDWKGLEARIEEGYFDRLGVTAIWISAPNDNPDGCFGGDLSGATYTGYHAYFPLSLDQPENHFGTMDELRSMTAAAHRRGIRILMDLDANHVFEDSDLWTAHKEWFNQERKLCGRDDNWNQAPIVCWFQEYLPDLDYRNDEAVEAMTDSAIEWARAADLDGFRVDAVKHMVHAFGYHLRDKVRRHLEGSGVPFWMVGETYVDAWGLEGGKNESTIRAYVSDRELTGQFDFPLYWEILTALGRRESTLAHLSQVAAATRPYYLEAFPGAVMSNFLGNHDVPRFITHADGAIRDRWGNGAKELGWENPPGLPTSPEPFRRLQQAFAFLMTLPGVPLIYYGDEIGMPGAGDPDNRRMMVFDGLSPNQVAVRDAVGKLAAFRAAHPATRSGSYVEIYVDPEWLAYGLHGSGDAVLVILNRGDARAVSFSTLALPGFPAEGPLTDALTGETTTVTGGSVSLALPAQGVAILAP